MHKVWLVQNSQITKIKILSIQQMKFVMDTMINKVFIIKEIKSKVAH